MKNLKDSQNKVLKKRKRIKIGSRGNKRVAAAEWVDVELTDNIKVKSKLRQNWRIARREGKPQEVLDLYEKEYKDQQIKTSVMSGKKSRMGEEKNNRTKE